MEALRGLGLATSLNEKYRQSYYAIINEDNVIEDVGNVLLETSGDIRDKSLKYKVISAGFDVGNESSIIINDKEYSLNMRGLNFVVYDNELQKVIYSCNYDTADTMQFSNMNIEQ